MAFDQCALISFDQHEIWVQQLLGHLTREAPTGFARVTVSQVIRADREMFTLMAQEIQSTLQPDARGVMPMEAKLKELRTDPRVTMFLLPLPRSAAKESDKVVSTAASSKADHGTPKATAEQALPPPDFPPELDPSALPREEVSPQPIADGADGMDVDASEVGGGPEPMTIDRVDEGSEGEGSEEEEGDTWLNNLILQTQADVWNTFCLKESGCVFPVGEGNGDFFVEMGPCCLTIACKYL